MSNTELITGSGVLRVEGAEMTVTLTTARKRTGYVALMDVLGFRELVAADSDSSQVMRYLGAVEHSLQSAQIEAIVFSDSIVLSKEGRDLVSLQSLCQVSSKLTLQLLLNGIAIRGAIAYGEYLMSPVKLTCRLSTDQFGLRKWLFRDSLLIVSV